MTEFSPMFAKDKSGNYSKCHFPTNKVKSSQRKRRKGLASREGLEKTSRATSSSRTLPTPGQPEASRRVKDQPSRVKKKSTDSKVSHPKTKEVKKLTYNNFGRSSDATFGSDQRIVKPNPYTDKTRQPPDTDAKLNNDNASTPTKQPSAQTPGATTNRHHRDTRTRNRAPPPQDENMSHCLVYDETDENPDDEEEADFDEDDDEDSAGVPQAVQAMRQTKAGPTNNNNKNPVDQHKRQMEDLARAVSSAHLVKRLSKEGYFNYNYSRHERVSFPSVATKVVHSTPAPKAGRKKKAEKTVQLVDW